MMLINLHFIKDNGIERFISQQKSRMDILTDFIEKFDDGRSKSFFCLSCALLPLDKLQKTHKFMKNKQHNKLMAKEQNRLLKDELKLIADHLNIELKLINK